MGRIGVFGGTFNPVHNGHISAMKTAVRELKLDKLIIMPSKIPPHKIADELVSECDRVNMLRLACDEINNCELCDFELKREGKSYSIYTMQYLKSVYSSDELIFIMGSDMLLMFREWYMYGDILKLCSLACLSRHDGDFCELEKAADSLRNDGATVYLVEHTPIDISSTQIRQALSNDENMSCYLPKKIVQYIQQHKLYGQV